MYDPGWPISLPYAAGNTWSILRIRKEREEEEKGNLYFIFFHGWKHMCNKLLMHNRVIVKQEGVLFFVS